MDQRAHFSRRFLRDGSLPKAISSRASSPTLARLTQAHVRIGADGQASFPCHRSDFNRRSFPSKGWTKNRPMTSPIL